MGLCWKFKISEKDLFEIEIFLFNLCTWLDGQSNVVLASFGWILPRGKQTDFYGRYWEKKDEDEIDGGPEELNWRRHQAVIVALMKNFSDATNLKSQLVLGKIKHISIG